LAGRQEEARMGKKRMPSAKTGSASLSADRGTLAGSVQAAENGLHGFDCNSVLTRDLAAAFLQQGFAFCVRYLSRSSPQSGGDLWRLEAQAILDGGLSLMAVQHVMKPGWVPTQ